MPSTEGSPVFKAQVVQLRWAAMRDSKRTQSRDATSHEIEVVWEFVPEPGAESLRKAFELLFRDHGDSLGDSQRALDEPHVSRRVKVPDNRHT